MSALGSVISLLIHIRDSLPRVVERDLAANKFAAMENRPQAKKYYHASGPLEGTYSGRGRVWTRADVRRFEMREGLQPPTRTFRCTIYLGRQLDTLISAAVNESIMAGTVAAIEPLLSEAEILFRNITGNARDAADSGSKSFDRRDEELNNVILRLIRLLPKETAPPGYANYFRDKYIYEARKQGNSLKTIEIAIQKHTEWEPLSQPGIRKAETTYCNKMGIEIPPKRKSGSKKGVNTRKIKEQ